MNKRNLLAIIVILTISFIVGWIILRSEKKVVASDGHGHGEEGEGEHGHAEHGDEHGELARVELTDVQLKNSGIAVEEAGSAKIRLSLQLFGKIGPNEDRVAHVRPRYPGIVKTVGKRLGEAVKKGDVVATIESSDSLQPYEVRAEIDGTVVEKDLTVGEVVTAEDKIYVMADLSTAWVNLNVYRRDFPKLRVGQAVIIDPGEGVDKIESKVSYISPFGAESTQTMLARAEIPNPTGLLRPGLFVSAEVLLEETEVDVAVKSSAIHTWEERDVVFVQEGDSFETRPVQLGRRDSEWVEVLNGLMPGEQYAVTNSFILKAELGKAGAAHEH